MIILRQKEFGKVQAGLIGGSLGSLIGGTSGLVIGKKVGSKKTTDEETKKKAKEIVKNLEKDARECKKLQKIEDEKIKEVFGRDPKNKKEHDELGTLVTVDRDIYGESAKYDKKEAEKYKKNPELARGRTSTARKYEKRGGKIGAIGGAALGTGAGLLIDHLAKRKKK